MTGEPVAPPVNAWQPPYPPMHPTPPAPVGLPLAAPMTAPQPTAALAVPRRRRLGLWLGLGAALLAGLLVLSVVAYATLTTPPTVSVANAAHISDQTNFGTRSVTWKSLEISVADAPDLPGCREWSQLLSTHALAAYTAADEAGAVFAFFFDSRDNAQMMVAQWKICDFAGGSSKSSLDQSGTTDGVLWLANSEWAYLSYGSVVVITALATDDLTACIAATKKLANSLR